MTTQKKYPTAVLENPDAWVAPENALNVEDSVCASKSLIGAGQSATFRVGTWGFSIPSNAVITSVFWAPKQLRYNSFGDLPFTLEARLNIGFSNRSTYAPWVAGGCVNTAYPGEDNITDMRAWTPADFNDDLITIRFTLNTVAVASRCIGVVDAVYVLVNYTVAAARGDGLHWIG